MRTNLVLEDKLIARAHKLTGINTKREVVLEALRTLILLGEQGEIRSLRGKLKWEGNCVSRARELTILVTELKALIIPKRR